MPSAKRCIGLFVFTDQSGLDMAIVNAGMLAVLRNPQNLLDS